MANEHEWPKSDGDIDFASEGNSQVGGVVTVEAGEIISAGEVCYIHKTDGKAYVSDASTQDDYRADGIAYGAAASGADVTLRVRGVYYEAAAFTDKEDYYLGTEGVTNGLSTTASAVRIGTALSVNELYVDIVQDDRDAVGTVKFNNADLAGVFGLTAFWQLCDGTTINDAESPLDGQVIKDMNGDGRFIKCGDTSDTETAAANHSHGTGSQVVQAGGSSAALAPAGSIASGPAGDPINITMVAIIKIK